MSIQLHRPTAPQKVHSNAQNRISSIDRKIEQLKKQLKEVKENKELPPKEKEERIKTIQKQIRELEEQKVKASKQEGISAVKMPRAEETEGPLAHRRRFDTFEHQPDTQSAGLYQLSRDENGNPVIKFEGTSKKSSEEEKPQIVKTTINTDAVDREIEKLKKSLHDVMGQLSSAKSPKEKAALEKKLSQIKAQLRQKDNDTYRKQHMKITEQKVVSHIGE